MVSLNYMVRKQSSPTDWRRSVNQQLIPAAIKAATKIENAMHDIRQGIKRHPVRALYLAAGGGAFVGFVWRVGRPSTWRRGL